MTLVWHSTQHILFDQCADKRNLHDLRLPVSINFRASVSFLQSLRQFPTTTTQLFSLIMDRKLVKLLRHTALSCGYCRAIKDILTGTILFEYQISRIWLDRGCETSPPLMKRAALTWPRSGARCTLEPARVTVINPELISHVSQHQCPWYMAPTWRLGSQNAIEDYRVCEGSISTAVVGLIPGADGGKTRPC